MTLLKPQEKSALVLMPGCSVKQPDTREERINLLLIIVSITAFAKILSSA